MGRISKEEQARYGGAEWCLNLVKQVGLEGAEKELQQRGIQGCPLAFTEVDRKVYSNNVYKHIYKSMLCLVVLTLRDEFGFGINRVKRFMERFENKAQVLNDDFAEWEDYETILKDELGITFSMGDKDFL